MPEGWVAVGQHNEGNVWKFIYHLTGLSWTKARIKSQFFLGLSSINQSEGFLSKWTENPAPNKAKIPAWTETEISSSHGQWTLMVWSRDQTMNSTSWKLVHSQAALTLTRWLQWLQSTYPMALTGLCINIWSDLWRTSIKSHPEPREGFKSTSTTEWIFPKENWSALT